MSEPTRRPLTEPADMLASARELMGRSTIRRFEVTARDIKRFAQAIGDVNPIHTDAAAARKAGHPGVVAPPLFCQVMIFEDLPVELLSPDGSPAEIAVPIPAERTVGGSSDFTLHRLVCAGEEISVTTTLKDITVKLGKSGPLYLVVVETACADAQGLPVASETATYVKRS